MVAEVNIQNERQTEYSDVSGTVTNVALMIMTK